MQILILGANSDIAHALARKFAEEEKADVFLASRDLPRLEKRCRDLEVRFGVNARAVAFDALDYDSHEAFYKSLSPRPDGVILAFGHYGDMDAARHDRLLARKIIDANFTGAASILSLVADELEARGHGFIIGISSVAALRGRQSNYVYGSAKAGLTVFLAGLRHRLSKKGIRVLTVLPGFVRTKMTEGLDLPEKMVAEPSTVADTIYRAWAKGKEVVYAPSWWRWIMLVIRMMPEAVFKRTKL